MQQFLGPDIGLLKGMLPSFIHSNWHQQQSS
jgi:hypothetical protein